MAFAEDGRIFFTERPGVVRVMKNDKVMAEPVISFQDPFLSKGEGGLLGIALDPAFATNHYIYVYQTYKHSGEVRNRVIRLLEKDNKAKLDQVILADIPGSDNHNGGRIKFGPDGMLYITAGDRYVPSLAQELTTTGGKILRIAPDGGIPQDNPFPGSPVYSLGHRNPQGLVWQPGTGKLYASEHGQAAHDEINLITSGENYGWPVIEGDREQDGMVKPLIHSGEETWAPSGMTFVTQGEWQGHLLVATLRGEQLLKFKVGGKGEITATATSYLFKNQYGRLRNVVEGPDGSLYIMTNNRDGRGDPNHDDDLILRLKPNPK
ncbi:glucose sorbosone dehydrogenase [Paenibacillus swuensis]|uniref:Glucose sorbosone dehydrogenase n=2 Tax=Paenibacillus swuensis TaxID=1178515 RepID=A0A172TPU1_9BACL|nr:glucose sorbosone dehydrogenase [Paenibacillus swuensis]